MRLTKITGKMTKKMAERLQTHPGLRWKMKSGVRESALRDLC